MIYYRVIILFMGLKALTLLLVLLLGCQKDPATDCNLTTNLCSCDRRTASQYPDCRDYAAMSVEDAQSDCTYYAGTFSQTTSCTEETRVGTCTYTEASEITYQRYYSANYANAAAGAGVCAYYKANCFVLSGNALCDATWTAG